MVLFVSRVEEVTKRQLKGVDQCFRVSGTCSVSLGSEKSVGELFTLAWGPWWDTGLISYGGGKSHLQSWETSFK